MSLKLTQDVEQAVSLQHGGPIQVAGDQQSYIVMSADMFRELSGDLDDVDMAESVAALQRSMAEVRAGRTRPVSEFLDELSRKYAVPS